jgi:hypothetical protein
VERLTDRTLGSGESARFTGPGAIVVLEVLTMDLRAEFRSAVSLRRLFLASEESGRLGFQRRCSDTVTPGPPTNHRARSVALRE